MEHKVFLDANILIEVILGRDKQAVARNLLEKYKESLNISALTAHLVIHFGMKKVSLLIIKEFLDDYQVLDLGYSDFIWAFNNIVDNDFEDALQISVAIRNGCTHFITFDQNLVKKYSSLKNISIVLA